MFLFGELWNEKGMSTDLSHTAIWGQTKKTVIVLSLEIFDINLGFIKKNTKIPLYITTKVMLAYLLVWYDSIT